MVAIVSSLLVVLIFIGAAFYILSLRHTSTVQHPSQKQQKSTTTFTPPLRPNFGPSQPGKPTLERLEQVTDQAFGTNNDYVPNSWGVHKSRIIRTSNGDIFTVYTSQGTDENNREW